MTLYFLKFVPTPQHVKVAAILVGMAVRVAAAVAVTVVVVE